MAVEYTKIDYAADVARYVTDTAARSAAGNAIAGIKKYVGIALQNKDSALVACSDATERKRIVDNFLKKKLGLTASDDELDKSVKDVCAQMKADKEKLRVTFYYLLPQKHGKLATFGG
jgi:hypothetical protein